MGAGDSKEESKKTSTTSKPGFFHTDYHSIPEGKIRDPKQEKKQNTTPDSGSYQGGWTGPSGGYGSTK